MAKKQNKKHAIARYLFAVLLLVGGIALNYLNIGKEFLGFESVGTWMIFVSLIMFAIITLQIISNRKRTIDERMESIAYKASRITSLFIIFGAFTIMIIDGINPIKISYAMFMSHMIAWIVLIYFVSYKILEKFN